jgi:hypothetical protein
MMSALTVLLMVTSGMTLTAFAAAPAPTGERDGSTPASDATGTTDDTTATTDDQAIVKEMAAKIVTEKTPVLSLKDGFTDLKVDPIALSHLPVGSDSGGRLIRGDATHRAGADVLIIDDDNSDASNTTTDFDNKGVYKRDTAHFMDDALTSLAIDHDTYLVESGRNGPDFQMMCNYSTLIWMFGYEWGGAGPTFTRADLNRIMSFMEAGGAVWFIGNAFISSLYGNVNYTTTGTNKFTADSFAKKYLGIGEYFPFSGVPNPVNTSANAIMAGTEQYAVTDYFDEYEMLGEPTELHCSITRPVAGGLTVLQGDSVGVWGRHFNDDPVGIAYNSGTWRASMFDLDIACIASAVDREDIVGKVMTWLGTPTLTLKTHAIMNWYTEVLEQSPLWTNVFDGAGWTNYYPGIVATVHTGEPFTYTVHFENQGATNERNMNLVITISTVSILTQGTNVYFAPGREIVNMTKQGSVDSKKTATVTGTYKPTRAGFYFIGTNITIANDARWQDNALMSMLQVPEFMDDMENGTAAWNKSGEWKLINDRQASFTPTHAWQNKKTNYQTAGDDLVSPVIDLRFYNESILHPMLPNGWNVIFYNVLYQGRMYGTGNDYVELQMKASNMTSWSTLTKWDGNTQVGAGIANGDFSSGWFYLGGYGDYLGNFAGQTLQFRWHFVKGSQFSQSWWTVDDVIVWEHEEKNVPPWFIEKTPAGQTIEMDVGSSLDLKVFVEDPQGDTPVTLEWFENFAARADWTGNHTVLSVPQNAPVGDKYHRGSTLNIAIKASDGLDFNDTYWNIRLLDPRPRATALFPANVGIVINEDEATDIDMSTWFNDIESQSWKVTTIGSGNIKVTSKADTILNITNKLPNWNGWDNITLKVTDSANSLANFTLKVRVMPVNDNPRIKVVQLPDGEQDEYYSFNLTATDVDNPDPRDLTWSDDSAMFTITPSGEVAFIPRNADVGYHTFNVTVADIDGARDVVQFTLFIANVNDPPVLSYIPPQFANQSEVFTLDVSRFVTDPDLLIPLEWRDHLTYRDDTPKLDTNLETGIITWDRPTNEDVSDFYFKITVQDSKGRYDEQEIKITVINMPDPPKLGTIPRQVLHQDSPYVFNIPFSDPDLQVPSASEELTFSNDGHQLFTIDSATGRIQFTPVNNQVGIWEINITVTDVDGLTDTKKVVFEVVNKNDAPELEYIKVQQLTEDASYTLQVHAVDPDTEPRLVDGLPVDPNERLEYRTNSTRVPIERDTGLIGFTPSNDDAKVGDIMVKITVIDRSSETATEDVLFKVTNVNDAPQELSIVGVVPGQQLQEGKTYQLIGSAKDIDNGAEQLTYMWYAGATVIGQTPQVQWKIKGHGAMILKLVVSDPDGGTATYNATVSVKAIEKQPGFGSAAAMAAFIIVAVMVAAVANRRRIH